MFGPPDRVEKRTRGKIFDIGRIKNVEIPFGYENNI